MDTITLVGIAASVLTAISMMPQLIKIAKEKKADDVSLLMLLVLLSGLILWVVYGFMIEDYIIVVANSFSVLVNITVVILTLVYKKNNSV